jgi:hypothetical protein
MSICAFRDYMVFSNHERLVICVCTIEDINIRRSLSNMPLYSLGASRSKTRLLFLGRAVSAQKRHRPFWSRDGANH